MTLFFLIVILASIFSEDDSKSDKKRKREARARRERREREEYEERQRRYHESLGYYEHLYGQGHP